MDPFEGFSFILIFCELGGQSHSASGFRVFLSPRIITLSFASKMSIQDFCTWLHSCDVLGNDGGVGWGGGGRVP